MKYIDIIKLPSVERINRYFARPNGSQYPWTVFFKEGFEEIYCRDITIFYGNNGSGKSTLLNLISEKIGAHRDHELFKDVVYDDYSQSFQSFDDFLREIDIKASFDDYGEKMTLPPNKRLITSDDIFKKIDKRVHHNKMTLEKVDNVRSKQDLLRNRESRLSGLGDFNEFSKVLEAKRLSKAKYARMHSPEKEAMRSNGETAIEYYQRAFEEDGIYLLDELSPVFQLELVKVIEETARYFNCQFFICTHSSLILSTNNSIIYNLDLDRVAPQNWSDLENVRIYYEFFKMNETRLKKQDFADNNKTRVRPSTLLRPSSCNLPQEMKRQKLRKEILTGGIKSEAYYNQINQRQQSRNSPLALRNATFCQGKIVKESPIIKND